MVPLKKGLKIKERGSDNRTAPMENRHEEGVRHLKKGGGEALTSQTAKN